MPDSLSKTIPIWCCVINRAANMVLNKSWGADQLDLHTPTNCVSKNEEEQIRTLLDDFVAELIDTGMDMSCFDCLKKPLRPLWITPNSILADDPNRFLDVDYLPIILITASRTVPGGLDRQHGYTYVQGAADDDEMWGLGLKAHTFWQNREVLLASGSLECEMMLREGKLEESTLGVSKSNDVCQIRRTQIYLSDDISKEQLDDHFILDLSLHPKLPSTKGYRHIPILTGKKGANLLHGTFAAVKDYLSMKQRYRQRILLVDDESCQTKASIVALFILLYFYDEQDCLLGEDVTVSFNKQMIKNRLVTLVNARPGLNPSRASLKSLNEFLMSEKYRA